MNDWTARFERTNYPTIRRLYEANGQPDRTDCHYGPTITWVTGLPPGPIANFGLAALNAVARPEPCKDYFFVSMNNSRHEFCPTLDCHNRAVQRWPIDYFRGKQSR